MIFVNCRRKNSKLPTTGYYILYRKANRIYNFNWIWDSLINCRMCSIGYINCIFSMNLLHASTALNQTTKWEANFMNWNYFVNEKFMLFVLFVICLSNVQSKMINSISIELQRSSKSNSEHWFLLLLLLIAQTMKCKLILP